MSQSAKNSPPSQSLTPIVTAFICLLVFAAAPPPTPAQSVAVVNSGFEDVTGMTALFEFHSGTMPGWDVYDPDGVAGSAYIGTLTGPDDNFFSEPAPEGVRVGILYNSSAQGAGEYGFQQTLVATVEGETTYTLRVEVGDIDSGTGTNSTAYNLEGFPGYRVELLADPVPGSIGEEVVLGSDNNTLAGSIVEGTFETSTVEAYIPLGHAQIGEQLAIRLVSLNQLTGLVPAPDNEVDFDDVRLEMTAVPVELGLFVLE